MFNLLRDDIYIEFTVEENPSYFLECKFDTLDLDIVRYSLSFAYLIRFRITVTITFGPRHE